MNLKTHFKCSYLVEQVLYGLTTPMMANYNDGNFAVEHDNQVATGIMQKSQVPITDLYGVITAVCGKQYVDCPICAVSPCTYHYNAEGYEILAGNVTDALSRALLAN